MIIEMEKLNNFSKIIIMNYVDEINNAAIMLCFEVSNYLTVNLTRPIIKILSLYLSLSFIRSNFGFSSNMFALQITISIFKCIIH